jgi:NIMA-interacting peptidyl-prolyl cis-trans isomerase 1
VRLACFAYQHDLLAIQSAITRTKAEALSTLQGHERRIRSGEATLGEIAVSESDCSSARKMGDLGYFGRGDMQKEFEDAVFKLKPGEISGIVETASGLHLIERYVLLRTMLLNRVTH